MLMCYAMNLSSTQVVVTLTSSSPSLTIAVHPCSMREFKVYLSKSSSPSPAAASSSSIPTFSSVPALSASLQNGSTPESFELLSPNLTEPMPCRYVKVEPLNAHGANYHISIWNIKLHGIADEEYVQSKSEINEKVCYHIDFF